MRFWIVPAVLLLAAPLTVIAAQENATEEEQPYDERGFIVDLARISLSFTSGSQRRYNYDDLRIYLSGDAHYAFRGDDYLDINLLINRYDRSYDDPRFNNQPLTDIFDLDLIYVFRGVSVETMGLRQVAGATFFSDTMFEDVDLGLGYGVSYNYTNGDLRMLAGMERNLGYSDAWSPLLDLSWTHNQRLSRQWRLRTKVDLMWTQGREAADDEEVPPETIYLLDGQLTYELIKGWNIFVRYFNDNSSDFARNYWSFGLSHYYRKPRPRQRR